MCNAPVLTCASLFSSVLKSLGISREATDDYKGYVPIRLSTRCLAGGFSLVHSVSLPSSMAAALSALR